MSAELGANQAGACEPDQALSEVPVVYRQRFPCSYQEEGEESLFLCIPIFPLSKTITIYRERLSLPFLISACYTHPIG